MSGVNRSWGNLVVTHESRLVSHSLMKKENQTLEWKGCALDITTREELGDYDLIWLSTWRFRGSGDYPSGCG